jgi:hypothetical protein
LRAYKKEFHISIFLLEKEKVNWFNKKWTIKKMDYNGLKMDYGKWTIFASIV